MRAVFLGIAALSIAYFLSRLNFIGLRASVPEQNVVICLSIGVILFNDPYYFISVFRPNLFSILI